MFDTVFFVFLSTQRNRVNILYWERNGFCRWLKQRLLEELNRQQESAQAYQTHIVDLKKQIKLLRDRLLGRKPEQTVEPNTPQLALFNEPESKAIPSVGGADEEVVEPTPRRGKRQPLSAEPPRIEVIHELPEHELACV